MTAHRLVARALPRTVVIGLAAATACQQESRLSAVQSDSARMVTAALRGSAVEEDARYRACRAADGTRYQDTGQTPCVRAPFVVTRLVAFTRDSAGACVWLENVLPAGVRHTDGGPFALPMSRDGELRRDALDRGDCERTLK